MKTMHTTYRRAGLAPIALLALVALAVALMCTAPSAAYAEHLKGADGWKVTFNKDAEMEDNFSQKEWADDLKGMQPGDDITFTVTLEEEHSAAADWYMANEVLKSLEKDANNPEALGSAYEYLLTYTNPAGKTTTLYDSTTVGGDNSGGLNDATNALQDYFFLDNLKHGETAHVDLKITMDGETEQNAYFDTLAQVKMKFAVELTDQEPEKKTVTNHRTIVKTGDPNDMLPLFIVMALSGVVLLVLAIVLIRRRKQESEEDAQ